MKRYLVFAGASYYPHGGMDDFKGDFDTLEDAVAEGKRQQTPIPPYTHFCENDWAHVYDTEERKKIEVEEPEDAA